jgi:hypothetical protein
VAGPRLRAGEQIQERILAETRGDPLALLELPRGRSPAELAGGFGLPREMSLSGRIEESFLRRVAALPEATWLMVLIAAAEPVGDPALMWRAASRLGLSPDAVASAEAEGLLKINGTVVFHPLVPLGDLRGLLGERPPEGPRRPGRRHRSRP